MGIPLVDLRAQYLTIKDDIDRAVARVLDSGQYVLGTEVTSFETEFADAVGVQHAVGVNSGTSALMLSLRAAGVSPGDEVLTVPFTFVATVAAIHAVGAHVRLVDIDPRSFTMDPDALTQQVTDRTKAVLPVHLFGQPVDMDPVRAVARQHGLTVVEDACQAHGASYNGQPVGGLGHVGCFSFYPTKNLAAVGDGGIIVTNDGRSRPDGADAARLGSGSTASLCTQRRQLPTRRHSGGDPSSQASAPPGMDRGAACDRGAV